MPAPKFKDSLKTNILETVTMVKRGQAYPNKFKPGENQYHYFFRKEDGIEYAHYATTKEEELLSAFQPGDTLQVVKAEGKSAMGASYTYLAWDAPGGNLALAASKAPTGSVTGSVKNDHEKKDYMDEQRVKNIAIPIQGFAQVILAKIIELGDTADIIQSKIDLALVTGETAWKKLYERAKELSQDSHDAQ